MEKDRNKKNDDALNKAFANADDDLATLFEDSFAPLTAPDYLTARTLEALRETRESEAVVMDENPSTTKKTASSPIQVEPVKKPRKHRRLKFAAAAIVAGLAIAVAGGSIAYSTETAYVAIEATPSVELAVNCFGFIIGVDATDDEGAALVNQTNVENKSHSEAVDALLDKAQEMGMLDPGDTVEITVSSDDSNQANTLSGQSSSAVTEHACNEEIQMTNMASRPKAGKHDASTSQADQQSESTSRTDDQSESTSQSDDQSKSTNKAGAQSANSQKQPAASTQVAPGATAQNDAALSERTYSASKSTAASSV